MYAAMVMDHIQGDNNNKVPIGFSILINSMYGTQDSGNFFRIPRPFRRATLASSNSSALNLDLASSRGVNCLVATVLVVSVDNWDFVDWNLIIGCCNLNILRLIGERVNPNFIIGVDCNLGHMTERATGARNNLINDFHGSKEDQIWRTGALKEKNNIFYEPIADAAQHETSVS